MEKTTTKHTAPEGEIDPSAKVEFTQIPPALKVPKISEMARSPELIDSYTTHFAKWEFQEDGLLVQLFARAGEKDWWWWGEYIPVCADCGGRRSVFNAKIEYKCPSCGSARLIYKPGRGEAKQIDVRFHKGAEGAIQEAADRVFMGDVLMDYVQELDSWVLVFKGLVPGNTSAKVLETFLDRVDANLDQLAS